MHRVPLYGYRGVVRGYAHIDDEDRELIEQDRWHLTGPGYASDGKWRLMHRVILGLEKGDKRVVDHINGEPLDNRRCNLRVVTHQQNIRNRTGPCKANTSGFRGVSLDPRESLSKRWIAQSCGNFLGRYLTKEEAAESVVEYLDAQGIPH